jgi:hypothetical protein
VLGSRFSTTDGNALKSKVESPAAVGSTWQVVHLFRMPGKVTSQ